MSDIQATSTAKLWLGMQQEIDRLTAEVERLKEDIHKAVIANQMMKDKLVIYETAMEVDAMARISEDTGQAWIESEWILKPHPFTHRQRVTVLVMPKEDGDE